jgi:HK97 family phage portal protein
MFQFIKSQFIKRMFGGSISSDGSGFTYTGDGNFNRGRFSPSTAGPLINESTSLTLPSVFHGLRLYGQTIGMLDWNVIKQERIAQATGFAFDHLVNTFAADHPVHWLLNNEPNEYQTAASFKEMLIGAHAIPYGNGMAYIERDRDFRPTALLPLMPYRTQVMRANGRIVYRTDVNGGQIDLESYEVFHIGGFGGNGLTGYPLIQLMKNTLGLTKAEEEFASQFFGNGCNFGTIYRHPGILDDAARQNLKADLQSNHGGLANAFGNIVLEEGMDVSKVGTEPDKAQMIEARSFQVTEVARVLGLAPHLLYDLSRSTNNNIEWQGIEAVNYSFKPWTNKLCQEANRKLLYESEKGTYFTQIDLKPLMRGDEKTQAEKDQIRFNTSAITPNEIRERDGLNPIAGGDQLFVNTATLPLNLVIQRAMADIALQQAKVTNLEDAAEIEDAEVDGVDQAESSSIATKNPETGTTDPDGQPGPAAPAPMVDDVRSIAILSPIVEAEIGRLLRREAKAIRSNAAKFVGDDDQFRKWFTTYQLETRQHVAEALQPIADTIAAIGQPCDVETLAAAYTTRTRNDVEKYLSAPPTGRADTLNLIVEMWTEERRDQMRNQIMEAQ